MTVLEGEILPPGSKLRRGAHPVIKGAGSGPVIKVPKWNVVNRHLISPMQHQILNILIAAGQPVGERIGHLPRTGDIVDALGMPRSKASFASVSRSLSRLETAGRIVSYEPFLKTRGMGRHYAVKP